MTAVWQEQTSKLIGKMEENSENTLPLSAELFEELSKSAICC